MEILTAANDSPLPRRDLVPMTGLNRIGEDEKQPFHWTSVLTDSGGSEAELNPAA